MTPLGHSAPVLLSGGKVIPLDQGHSRKVFREDTSYQEPGNAGPEYHRMGCLVPCLSVRHRVYVNPSGCSA